MKKLFLLIVTILVLSLGALAQENMDKMGGVEPTQKDKTEAIPAIGVLKRGAVIGSSDNISVRHVLNSPESFVGKTVTILGIVVRSCKTEGCWAELAEDKDSKSIRVILKDHSFFIPLQSAGSYARAEGTVAIKTLSKEQVDHLIKDDGAKFENRNADGTVTEISFEATGIELTRTLPNQLTSRRPAARIRASKIEQRRTGVVDSVVQLKDSSQTKLSRSNLM